MGSRFRFPLFIGCVLVGFVLVFAIQLEPADPAVRVSSQYRLARLIEDRREVVAKRRTEASRLRRQVDQARSSVVQSADSPTESMIDARANQAGVAAVTGAGLRVTLKDSAGERPLDANVNDFVIHSEDVQAIVNALWSSGAEAIAINGQRLVSTSAVLCVGNTLLLNGTVHAPPYVVSAIGAQKAAFEGEPLVAQLRDDVSQYGLGFDLDEVSDLRLPRYPGSIDISHAKPLI